MQRSQVSRPIGAAATPSVASTTVRARAERAQATKAQVAKTGVASHLTRATLAIALLAIMALGLACGSVPKRHHFALSYPLEPSPAAMSRPPLHPLRVRIKPFGVALPYNRPQIVYRQSLFEFDYYAFKLWAAKPQHMMRELVARHLDAARLVTEVTRDYGEELPDYELAADVLAIEEYDSGDVWYGHLAIRFQLVRFRDRVPVWNYQFDRKLKVFEKKPVYVVRALSRIAEEEMRKITVELDQVFARERGVEPTLDRLPPTPTPGAPGDAEPPSGTPRPDDLIVPDGDLIVPDDPAAPPTRAPLEAPRPAGEERPR